MNETLDEFVIHLREKIEAFKQAAEAYDLGSLPREDWQDQFESWYSLQGDA